MPPKIDNFATLQSFFSKLRTQVQVDMNQVVRVNYAIIGLIVLTHNKDKPMEIGEGFKHYSDILWFFKNEERFSLIFNEKTGDIEIRKNSIHGSPLHSLSNYTPLTELVTTFEQL